MSAYTYCILIIELYNLRCFLILSSVFKKKEVKIESNKNTIIVNIQQNVLFFK